MGMLCFCRHVGLRCRTMNDVVIALRPAAGRFIALRSATGLYRDHKATQTAPAARVATARRLRSHGPVVKPGDDLRQGRGGVATGAGGEVGEMWSVYEGKLMHSCSATSSSINPIQCQCI